MPTLRISFLAFSCSVLASLAGCSRSEPPVTLAPAEFRTVPIAAPAKQPTKACAMVTAEQMTAILGGAVAAGANGQDKCIFTAVAGPSPYAELKIERGDGEIAMRAMGMMNRAEPGITDPLAGLGDQAAQVGPAFMIRSGQDLVTIVFSGVDDAPKKARAVFDIVAPKL
jgi:hypothetical protein